MAYTLSDTTSALVQNIDKQPTLILEIEGSQYVYGSAPILEDVKWDDPRVNWDNQDDVNWDGQIEKINSKPYISLKQSTKSLTQQLIVEKGGSGSISTMEIALVDFRNEVGEDLSFDQITDALGKPAKVYMGIAGGVHPKDSIQLLNGFIDDLKYVAGLIKVSISHPENLKRQSIYEQYQGLVTANFDNAVTTISVGATASFFPSSDIITSYIQIGDEVMEVVSNTTTSFEVVRGTLGTIPEAHETEDEVTSFYRIQGLPTDIALKLLLSKPGNAATTHSTIKVKAINALNPPLVIPNTILLSSFDAEVETGLVVGDKITLTGTASNDGEVTISAFDTLDTGDSYVTVEESLSDEVGLDLDFIYRSQFNVLNEGLGLAVDQVDTESFLDVATTFSANFIEYDYYVKDTIDNAKDFIDKELFLPQGIYTIPRKAKISCKFTAPPFSIETLPTLNTTNLVNVSKIEMRRSTHKYLFNEVVYRYNEGTLDTKLFDKTIRVNTDSIDRIRAGRKRFLIEARGLRRNAESVQVLNRIGAKILNRYKFAARYIKNVNPTLEVGMNLEIGDIVFFGGENTQLMDLQIGTRTLPVSQYEIVNKKLDIERGQVKLELLETGFSLDGLFGVFSPSSKLDVTSTISRLILSPFFPTCTAVKDERLKWAEWVGAKIRVRSDDYTYDETTTIDRLDPTTETGLILDPPLSSTPPNGAIVELARYGNYSTNDLDTTIKLKYTFLMPSMLIANVTDPTTFEMDNVDGLEIGMLVAFNSAIYDVESSQVSIDNIVGSTITLSEALNITPLAGYELQTFSYPSDKGYRFL